MRKPFKEQSRFELKRKKIAVINMRTGAQEPRPDHTNFKQDRKSWEDAVFVNAAHFTTVRYRGDKGKWQHADWPAVRAWLAERVGSKHSAGSFLVYAVTENERHVCLNGEDFERLDALWTKWNPPGTTR